MYKTDEEKKGARDERKEKKSGRCERKTWTRHARNRWQSQKWSRGRREETRVMGGKECGRKRRVECKAKDKVRVPMEENQVAVSKGGTAVFATTDQAREELSKRRRKSDRTRYGKRRRSRA